MQCPLCREPVADENALQVHYLMSCLGYLQNASTKNEVAMPRKKVVQFRWIKTKPTLAREVYLISSLAGSVKLEWSVIDECFLSEQVEVPEGLHVCQLVVDGDAMSTDDFEVSQTSRTIDVFISQASHASAGSKLGGKTPEPQGQLTPPQDRDKEVVMPSKKVVQFRWMKKKATLAKEAYLISSLAGSVKLKWSVVDECFLSDQVEVPEGLHVCQLVVDGDAMSTEDFQVSQTSRTIDVFISQENVSVGETNEPRGQLTPPKDGDKQDGISDVTTHRGSLYSELLKDQVLHGDSLERLTGSLTRTSGEHSGHEEGKNTAGSSLDQKHSQRGAHSRKKTELPGQRVQDDIHVSSASSEELEAFLQPARLANDTVTTNGRDSLVSDDGELSVSLSSHEDLERRPEILGQSNGENESQDDQETSLVDRRDPLPERDHEGNAGTAPQVEVNNDRPEITGDRIQRSSGNDPGRISDDTREKPSGSRREQTAGGGHESTRDLVEQSGDNREPPGNDSRPSRNGSEPTEMSGGSSVHSREPLDGNPELESNILRRESLGNVEERVSTRCDQYSVDHRRTKTVGSSEGISSDERRGARSRSDQNFPVGDDNISKPWRNVSDYLSLPTRLNSDRTQEMRTVRSYHFSEDIISPRRTARQVDGTQTSSPVSPPSSGHHGSINEPTSTGTYFSLSGAFETDDLLFRNHPISTSRINGGFAKDTQITDVTSKREMDSKGAGNESSTQIVGPSPELGIRIGQNCPGSPAGEVDALARGKSERSRPASAPSGGLESASQQDNPSGFPASTRGVEEGVSIKDSAPSRDRSASSSEVRSHSWQNLPGGVLTKVTRSVDDGNGIVRTSSGNPPSLRRVSSAPSQEMGSRIGQTYRNEVTRSTQSLGADLNGQSENTTTGERDENPPSGELNIQSRQNEREEVTRRTNHSKNATDRGRDASAASSELGTRSSENYRNASDASNTNQDLNFLTRERGSQCTSTNTSKNRYEESALKPRSGNYAAFEKHGLQGSFMDDIEIRRPPLYTPASSRPLSPPQGEQDAVSSESRMNEARTVSSEGLPGRLAPTGSATSLEDHQTKSYGSTSSAKQWSDDYVKELLESLKKNSAGRTITPETSPLERPATASEEMVKKLHAKNASYKKKIEELRANVIELTKALSLAEANKKALKEQEDISKELTSALGYKEKKYAELEARFIEMEQIRDAMVAEFGQTKTDYEKKIQKLKRFVVALEQEVETLRANARKTSPMYEEKYKKLLDEYGQSLAVSASLKDQVQTLKTQNKKLQEKLDASISSTRERFTNHVSPRDHYGSSINGYPETNTSPTFSSRQQPDRLRGYSDSLRKDSRYLRDDSGNLLGRTDSSRGYTDSSRGHTDSSRRFEEHVGLRERPESPRISSDLHETESYESRPWLSEYPGRQSRSRRRFAADDRLMGSSDLNYKHVLPKRSHSSGSKSKPFVGEELDRRSKSRSGSFDNLVSKYSNHANDLALTGHRVNPSPPSSPDRTSPSADRKYSPGKVTFAPTSPRELEEGMTLMVTRHHGTTGRGIVKYVGRLPHKGSTVYVGLELCDADGKHDGTFNQQRFFKCKAYHGIFVPFDKVVMAYKY